MPLDYVEVIRTLNRAAKGGDVAAARELRAWKAEHPEVDETVKLDQQPRVMRDRLLRRLLTEEAELLTEEGEEGQSTSSDPDQDDRGSSSTARGTEEGATPPDLGVPAVGEPEAPQAHTQAEKL